MNTMRLAIIPRVEHLLDVYDQLETPQEKNEMLKACLEKVIYTKTEGGRYTESNHAVAALPPNHTYFQGAYTYILDVLIPTVRLWRWPPCAMWSWWWTTP